MDASFKNLLAATLLLICLGCASTDALMTDKTKRKPTANPEMFANADQVKVPYKKIGALQMVGAKEDEFKAIKYFQKSAAKLGADGFILDFDPKGYQKWVGFIPTTAIDYKCILIVFDK